MDSWTRHQIYVERVIVLLMVASVASGETDSRPARRSLTVSLRVASVEPPRFPAFASRRVGLASKTKRDLPGTNNYVTVITLYAYLQQKIN